MLQTVHDWFWWNKLWLPCNYTWEDLRDVDGLVLPKASHFYVTMPYAILFMIVRYGFERLIATPIAVAMGIKNKARLKSRHNPLLEECFVSCSKHPSQSEIYGLAKKSNLSELQVERWFRRRRNADRPSVLKKFQESCWRFVFYLCAFIGGVAVLYDKPWFYEIWQVWENYPKQSYLPSQYWYYVIELSFYWSLLFSVASDVRRKDFKVQVIHHCATIFLLNFSWCVNYVRVGTMTLLVHDVSDFLLEAAKMCSYAGWKTSCNVLFVVFAVMFIITRLIIFPFWIIYATVVYPLYICPTFFLYYFFNMIMFTLQLLHIYWSYLIFKMVKKVLTGNARRRMTTVMTPQTMASQGPSGSHAAGPRRHGWQREGATEGTAGTQETAAGSTVSTPVTQEAATGPTDVAPGVPVAPPTSQDSPGG